MKATDDGTEDRVEAARRRVTERRQIEARQGLTLLQIQTLEEVAVAGPNGYASRQGTLGRLLKRELVARTSYRAGRPQNSFVLTAAGRAALAATGFDLSACETATDLMEPISEPPASSRKLSSAPFFDAEAPFRECPAPSPFSRLPVIDYRGLRKPAEPVPEGGNVHRLKPRGRALKAPRRPREDGAA